MKVLLAGDSTVADYPAADYPMMGWGQALAPILKKEKVEVANFAKCGATTSSFMEEGLWARLLAEVAEGDLVLLQFGHNDQKPENKVPFPLYYQNLKSMIHAVKQKEGQPIICSPVERREVTAAGLSKTLAAYTPLLRQLAQEEEVPFFDLNHYTFLFYQELGAEQSRTLFFGHGDLKHQASLLAEPDNTHFNEQGAHEVARYVAIRLKGYLSQAPLFSKIYYGACMYPEVWEPAIFEKDVQHLKDIKMNFARIGEFAWEALEPREGEYNMELLRSWLETYAKHDIDVCLGIPTPTPPRWLTVKYPDVVIKNSDGTTMTHGSRQHPCTNNPIFREKAYQLTRKMAAVAKEYANVIAFQLDNEFKCHVDLCYCDECTQKWHGWLAEEYVVIEELNHKWGTQVWSERYGNFAEVVVPTATPFLHNSALMNAFRKFTAQTLNEFAHESCHYIRMETAIPITHNTAFGFNLINDELFSALDVVGFDTYPTQDNYANYMLNLDTWRNLKGNNNEMLLLETSTSHVGHIENYVSPNPTGFLTAEIFAGFAGNLKSFTYWHFRGHRFGVEQTHSTVVTAWGEPGMGYDEVVSAGELVEELRPTLAATTHVASKVAMLYSDTAKRFYTIETGGVYNHREIVTNYYGTLIETGISVEVLQETSDFTGYNVLMVPFVRGISPTLLKKFQDFVAAGGKLILGPMTGDRTLELTWPEKNGLDLIGDWLGLNHIQQFSTQRIEYTGTYQNKTAQLDRLITTFSGEDWETLGETQDGKTFIAKRQLGAGEVIYCGGLPTELKEDSFWCDFIKNEVKPLESNRTHLKLGDGLVKYHRHDDTYDYYFVVNMSLAPAELELMVEASDVLNNLADINGVVSLESYGYKVLRVKK